eukprot:COSAG02_NODE_26561_length_630_cov_1.056497_2_plen_85_part_00
MPVPKRKTVAADGESGGVPVTVLRVFDPSVTSNVHWPAGTGPQLLPREYLSEPYPVDKRKQTVEEPRDCDATPGNRATAIWPSE